ncbi:glycosyltransferase [Clostridium sp.]|uniref:glycosyltransferase n=1 Tax=Clostridium sp. TaxID=1506 RepID=UPI003F2F3E60
MLYKREEDLVSIIVTNYNNENYIEDCLDGILNQTYKNIEVILVNDASTDNSLDIIHDWIDYNFHSFDNKDYLTVINLPRNVGFSGAVSVGLFMCKGEFIAFHDGDDISVENRIEKQVEYLKNNPNIGVIGSNYSVFSNEDPTPKILPNGLAYSVEHIKDIYSKGGNCVCYGTLMIRGDIFDKIGGLSRKLPLVEDYEFITRLLPFGVNNLTDILYNYRVHQKQRSRGLYKSNNIELDNSNLNVLLVLDRFNIGGTETHVLSLAKELISQGVSVVLIADDGPLSVEFEKLDCKIYNVDFPLHIITDLNQKSRYMNRITQIIKEEKITIVHAHQSPSGSICIDLCKDLGIPCVFTVHGLYYQDIAYDRLQLVDSVISVSQPVYDWLLGYNIQSTVIPNAVDFDKSLCLSCNSSIRSDLNIDEDALIVLYCSRIAWGKTAVAENLIRVSRDLRRLENLNIHVLIIGDGPDLDKVTASAQRANTILGKEYIHVLGPKTDLNDYYLACDCVVGTGRVAIEAMSFGKPIIASGNHGYFGILNENNLDNSWRVYFGDHESSKINNASYLYKDLKYIYNHKESLSSLSTACTTWGKNKFDVKIIIEDILQAYRNSLSNYNPTFRK